MASDGQLLHDAMNQAALEDDPNPDFPPETWAEQEDWQQFYERTAELFLASRGRSAES